MGNAALVNQYISNHYEGMTPEQLILMLYKGALDHIKKTKTGIAEKDIKKRGEHLSKTIAIITELLASVDPTMKDESTQFLRGLYKAILAELPRVSLTNDVEILNQTEVYITELKKIWEQDAMTRDTKPLKQPPRKPSAVGGYGPRPLSSSLQAFSV